jgi:hypothetical protein
MTKTQMIHRFRHLSMRGITIAMLFGILVAPAAAQVPASYRPAVELPDAPRWYRGNSHTHSWWSDGDSPPETIVAWYKAHGYDFLVLSDHNILAEGEKWCRPEGRRADAAEVYEEAFGPDWVVKRTADDGKTEYRLKTLSEFRTLFEEPGGFLLIPGEEISDGFKRGDKNLPIHLNGVNLRELVPPAHGDSVLDTLQNNIDAVLEQRRRTGQPMFPHVNHPNFGWALRAEDIMKLRGEQFFEVYNGHPGVRNNGDEIHPTTERMWDIILTKRLGELDLPIMYGIATDDAHSYVKWGVGNANPGRGWVMVRARFLTPNAIVEALERGDFYASTGVCLKDVRFEDNTLSVEIDARPDVTYTTQFVGTLVGYDGSSREPAGAANQPEEDRPWVTRVYSDDVGKVLASMTGTRASYRLSGKELYVRARVTASRLHPNPSAEGDPEMAWVQPVRPASTAAGAASR